MLIDEETYLRIYLNNLDWPLEAKETLVVTNGCIDLTETERVRFVRGNVVTELRRIKENGDGMVVAYGGETGVLLLDNGLADEIVMTTVPVLVGNGEKGLECGPNDGRIWAVRSSEADKNDALVRYTTTGLDEQIFVSKYQLQLPTEQQLKELILKTIRK